MSERSADDAVLAFARAIASPDLSEVERSVLFLLLSGSTISEVASALGQSRSYVHALVARLGAKLSELTESQLASLATVELGDATGESKDRLDLEYRRRLAWLRWLRLAQVSPLDPSEPEELARHPSSLGEEGQESFSQETAVTIGKEGRVTLPAHLRQLLGLKEGSQLVVDVDFEHRWLRLRPAVTIPLEEAWAYTPKHLAQLTRALAEVAQGQTSPVSEEEVAELLQDERAAENSRQIKEP